MFRIMIESGEVQAHIGRLSIGIGFRSAAIAYGSSFCFAWSLRDGFERLA